MRADEVTATLRHVDGARRRARADLSGFWFPLVLFGGITLCSPVVALLFGGIGLGVYWPVAGVVGWVAIGWYYSRHEATTGLQGAGWPYGVGGAALVVTCTAAGWLGGPTVVAYGPWLAVAVVYLGFAWLERSTALAALTLVLAGGVLALAWSAPADPALVSALVLAPVYGAAFLATGLALRAQARARRDGAGRSADEWAALR